MYHQHVLQYSRLKDTFMKIYHRWMYYTGLSIIMKLIRNNMLHFMTNIASVYKVHVHEIDIRMYLLRHMLTKKKKNIYIYIQNHGKYVGVQNHKFCEIWEHIYINTVHLSEVHCSKHEEEIKTKSKGSCRKLYMYFCNSSQ